MPATPWPLDQEPGRFIPRIWNKPGSRRRVYFRSGGNFSGIFLRLPRSPQNVPARTQRSGRSSGGPNLTRARRSVFQPLVSAAESGRPIVSPAPAALTDKRIGIAAELGSAARCKALLKRVVGAVLREGERAPWIAILRRAVVLRMSRASERKRNRHEGKPHICFSLSMCWVRHCARELSVRAADQRSLARVLFERSQFLRERGTRSRSRGRRPSGKCCKTPLLERDDFSSNRHPALLYWWSMIFSENRYPLFGIML